MNYMSLLFDKWLAEDSNTVVALLNHSGDVVGALYLQTIYDNNKRIAVLETTCKSEKYYIYLDGIAIYFSNFKKLGV